MRGLSLCLVLDFDLDRDRNLCWSFLKLEELSSLRIVECGDVRRWDGGGDRAGDLSRSSLAESLSCLRLSQSRELEGDRDL